MNPHFIRAVCLGCLVAGSAAAADLVLFNFEGNFDFTKPATHDATVSEAKSAAGSALLVATGHKQQWPGVTLAAPAGSGELTPFALVALKVTELITPLRMSEREESAGMDLSLHGEEGYNFEG